MPNFLNPISALIAAAIVVPSLLVLYFLKLRRKEQDVSSTLLWKKAVQDLQVNAPFQRLRRNLLLLLQMLILAALLAAFARPVTNYKPPAGKLVVVLIDRSASMAAKDPEYKGRSRLDEAKARAKAILDTLEKDGSASVIAFDDSAETIQPFTTDVSLLKRKVDTIQQTDRKTRLKLAYQLADAQSTFNPDQLRANVKAEVFLISDGRTGDTSELKLLGNLHYEKIGTDLSPNIAVVSMSAKRNYERPTQVQVFSRLANFGPIPTKADIQLTVDGQVKSAAVVTLLPERYTEEQRRDAEAKNIRPRDSVEFDLEIPTAAVVRIEQMNKENDALPADDSATVIVPAPKHMNVALVTNGNYFLERVVASLGMNPAPTTISPAEYERTDAGKFDAIIFDGYAPKTLPNAGSFIYINSLPPSSLIKAKEIAGKPVVETGLIGVLDWKRDHPILKGLGLNALYVTDPIQLQVPREVEVLVDGLRGPLIVLSREGQRTHLVVGFDVVPSTWPLIPSFPVFMYNAMQFLALGAEMEMQQSYDPGATPRIPRSAIAKIGPEIHKLSLNGPAGKQTLAIPLTGDFALPALEKVGVYTLDPPVPQYEQIAVNLLDPVESNLVPTNTAPNHTGDTSDVGSGKSRLELWWWIVACGAIPFLLIEWYVWTRRVHL